MKKIPFLFAVCLLVACAPSAAATGVPLAATVIQSLDGTWVGTLDDSVGGRQYQAELIIAQPAGSADLTGQLILTEPDSSWVERYEITGAFDGSAFSFHEPDGRAFQGTADSFGLRGQVAWCRDCETWGSFQLTRQETAAVVEITPSESSFQIGFAALSDGATLPSSIGANGLPVSEVTVFLTDPLGAQYTLGLEADGMQVQMKARSPSKTVTMQWTPWHGNGEYVLTIEALDWLAGTVLDSASVRVNIGDIPAGSPTVKERFIQEYRAIHGLTLTDPVFLRFASPDPDDQTASRWISSAYIGDSMYEINIFDNGFAGGLPYPLGTDNGFCPPRGNTSMLVVFVDYGNTGLDAGEGVTAFETFRQDANRRWAEYSASVGLSNPILQVGRMETATVAAPPVPGQPLTAAEVRSLTGKDPSDFDWLVEIDLDADNSVAGSYGGLGVSLNGGCMAGGAQRVNIAFSAMDRDGLVTYAPGSVFFHELQHGMGWQHWWPNGTGRNADWLAMREVWDPYLLFGWTDADGDGTIEILDSTPYGLIR